MSIDLRDSAARAGSYVSSSPLLNGIFSNKIVVSLMIAAIMILIVMIVYPAKKGTGVGLLIKMFVYMATFTGIVMFLHDGILESNFKEQHHDNNALDLSRESINNAVSGQRVDVMRNITTSPGAQAVQITVQPVPAAGPPGNQLVSAVAATKNIDELDAITKDAGMPTTGSSESGVSGGWYKTKSQGVPKNPYA